MTLVVVGAGVAGLSAAFAARRAGIDVLVLEASDREGGLVETERVDDLLIEHGADALVESKPVGMHMIHELGLDDDLLSDGPAPRRAFLATDRGLVPMPDGLGGMMPRSPWSVLTSPLLSTRGKLRLLREPLALKSDHDETVAELFDRRLGPEARERLVDPLMRAIYGVPGDRLGMKSALPHLLAVEQRHGSFARAMLAARGRAGGLSTLRGGMSMLVDALVASVGRDRIQLGCGVTSIVRRAGGYRVLAGDRSIRARAVIVCTPAWRAARLVANVDPDLASELAAIEHVDADAVSLAYPRASIGHALDGTGHVVATGASTRACTWASSKWHCRAPHDVVLFRAVVDAGDADDRELVAIARRELESTLDIAGEPILVRLRRRRRALPIPGLGHSARRARIAARGGTLRVAGAGEGALGVPDCIASGLRAFRTTLGAS